MYKVLQKLYTIKNMTHFTKIVRFGTLSEFLNLASMRRIDMTVDLHTAVIVSMIVSKIVPLPLSPSLSFTSQNLHLEIFNLEHKNRLINCSKNIHAWVFI